MHGGGVDFAGVHRGSFAEVSSLLPPCAAARGPGRVGRPRPVGRTASFGGRITPDSFTRSVPRQVTVGVPPAVRRAPAVRGADQFGWTSRTSQLLEHRWLR
ncbi:hypothetical protein GCM10027075_23730 [Streptomyces heilongjiangensis]